VTKRHDIDHGVRTGAIAFNVMECSRSQIIKIGAPLGRGNSEESALEDFCFRANLDDASLKLKRSELVVERD
jgi:hypothetical protein